MRYAPLSVCLALSALLSSPITADEPFPAASLLPKAETGALRFLERHPDADGRGVVVAILDTGVDPGAPGLQVTSDGRPKIIDVVDGTGSGDVDTSTVAEPGERGTFEGLTGRTLTIDPTWTNPSGKYRLGVKSGYDLFPGPLVARMKRERRREFDREQHALEAQLRRELDAWKRKHSKPDDDQKTWHRELELRIEQLRAITKSYDDPGPLFDCVLFHDGEHWRAVVDTDEDGDLADETPLTNFATERRFATFPLGSLLNFAVNVYDDGDVLSIVVDSGTHGTHVAGIVAANDPEDPARNGVAPGARIVSVKIGDGRLGGMETGVGFERAIAAVLRNRCDAINLSFGEPTAMPNRGRIVELFGQLVDEHGVVFVSSAGNAGPALSTVGAPGGTSSAILGIGAYVPPELARAAYALRDESPETGYTWTSRGPTADGDLGVDLFAPGGAVAPVPTWSLARSERMNGTSMASPNACGNIALLLSAAKESGLAYTPYSIRRALMNTARPIESLTPFAQGAGLIQVDRAWSHLEANATRTGERLRYDVNVDGNRGIYLRESAETSRPFQAEVDVRPVFPESTEASEKAAFEQTLRLETTADWIAVGEFLHLHSGGRGFDVRIDPGEVEPGVHFGWILGIDPDAPERGPVFRVPVTVVKPEPVPADGIVEPMNANFEATTIVRRFLAVPNGATWADVVLRVPDDGAPDRRFLLHALQLGDGEIHERHEFQQYVTLAPRRPEVRSFSVERGRTLELCLAQYWSSLGEGEVEIDVRFHGLVPDDREVVLEGGEATATVTVSNELVAEQLAPKAELKTLRSLLLPKRIEHDVASDDREQLPHGEPVEELRLFYDWHRKSAGSITIRVPELDELLYESPTGGYVLAVYDEHDRRVGFDDVFPDAMKLEKGKHEIVLRLRHSDPAVLDRYEKLPLQVDRNLKSGITLRIAESRAAALASSGRFDATILDAGTRRSVTFVAPAKVPGDVVAGDVLLGTVTYGRGNVRDLGAGQRPGGFPLRWAPAIPPRPTTSSSPPEKSAPNVFDTREDRRVLAKLKRLDTDADRKEHLAQIVELCNRLIDRVDLREFAAEYGTRIDPDDKEAVAQRKRFDRRRDLLVDLLYRKGRALGYMELPDVVAKHPIADPAKLDAAFEANFRELAKWVDTTDTEYVLLHVRRDRRKGRLAHALKELNAKIADSPPTYWYLKKRRDLYEELGWTRAFEYEQRRLAILFPKLREPL